MKINLDVIPWDIPTHIYLKFPPGEKANGFRSGGRDSNRRG